jgi:hypothetical protein
MAWLSLMRRRHICRCQPQLSLIDKALAGKLTLHLPALCLTEARHPLRTKFQPRATADSVRKYLGWATREGKVEHSSADTVRVILDQYEATVSNELDDLDYRLQKLTQHSGIDVFALSEIMLARTIQLSTMNLDLKAFDQAILAAVLVRAEQLRDEGADDLAFCEVDSGLQPWDKNGRTKQRLPRFTTPPACGFMLTLP